MASTGHASLIGATLGGYEVEALIGRGAMATVYLARDVKLNRRVALKVLLGSLARNPATVKRFHLEAQAAAPLRHPNIVRVYSAGVERGTPYIAMEFVEGEPLDRFLRRKGQLHWVNALHIAEQVAMALDAAHRAGIVHRDVKPSNIMLDRMGNVRLTDFGIANVQSADSGIPEDTAFLGTPQYMAPEQFSRKESGPKSDIFSLGVVVYRMVSGHLPFEGESSMALIKAITTEDPPRLNRIMLDVPDDVARLVAYMIEKDPKRRPSNAQVVISLIERVQAQKGGVSAIPEALTAFLREQAEPQGVSSQTPTPSGRRTTSIAKRKAKRRPFSWQRAAVSALVAATGLVSFVVFPLNTLRARETMPGPAPQIQTGIFTQRAPGVLQAQLLNEGFAVESVHWSGLQPALVAKLRGLHGTLLQGSSGVLNIRPYDRTFLSLQPPISPAQSADFWKTTGPEVLAHAIPPTPDNAPFHNAVFSTAYENNNGPQRREALLLAHRVDEAVPRPAALYRGLVEPHHTYGAAGDAQEFPAWRVVPNPDGRTICLVLYNAAEQAYFLVERDVSQKPLDRVGPRLATIHGRLFKQSVQYTPDGSRIAYISERRRGLRELWVVPVTGESGPPRIVASGLIGIHAAFSPDGSEVAVLDLEGEVQVFRIGQTDPVARFPARGLSKEAWNPTGSYLVVVNQGEAAAAPQLWAVPVRSPSNAVELTNREKGFLPNYAVSRAGDWVAAVAAETTMPEFWFIDLTRVQP